jgi:hypothetical protein
MQKRVILLITVLLPLLAIVMLLRERDTKEPYYNGHPLHYWVLALMGDDPHCGTLGFACCLALTTKFPAQ